MKLVQEFREFALRGSVVDLAIGVVIGAAFGKIVDSFVNDILMPPLGLLTGGHDFTNNFITLSRGSFDTLEQAKAAGAATLNYGVFVNQIISFLIIAAAIFLFVRSLRKPAPAPAPTTRECPECMSEIPLTATRCRYCAVTVAR
jgi:large conductance mechanosensitive channel